MPRRSRIDAPGALHHIIVRGIERKTIFATGFALGYMAFYIIPFIFSPISFPILAFFIYQIFIYKYFWGEYRGHFEYAYRERQIYKDANEIIRKHLDTVTFIMVSLDELSAIGSERDDVYEKLLRKKEIDSNKELRFLILMKYANSLKKGDVMLPV